MRPMVIYEYNILDFKMKFIIFILQVVEIVNPLIEFGYFLCLLRMMLEILL